MECVQVFVSCESRQQAKTLVAALLQDRIIACGQIIQGVESFYRWQGQIEQATECLLLLKTTQHKLAAIKTRITQLHSYDTPEILAVPVVDGASDYLKWINEQVK